MAEAGGELNAEQLGQMIQGQSDAEIIEAVQSMGTDTVLSQAFQGMKDAFLPERATGQSAVIQWDITAPEGTRSWQLRVENGTCSLAEGSTATPRVTLGLALADFLRFLAGQLDGMQAFMSGKLRVSGDLMLAQSMQAWFAR